VAYKEVEHMSDEVIVFARNTADEFKLLDREFALPVETIKKNLHGRGGRGGSADVGRGLAAKQPDSLSD
jgi:hypothetical protein